MFALRIDITAVCLVISLILIGIGFILKMTDGLFWARFPRDFIKDQENPDFEREREVGMNFSRWILRYVPPVSLVLLVLLLLKIVNVLSSREISTLF